MKPDWKKWAKWYSLVNMSPGELKTFYNSEEGKVAGMKRGEASKLGISSGRESATWLMKMIPSGQNWNSAQKRWTPEMWKWAGKQNSFISRMRGNRGGLYEMKDGKKVKTRKHLSLLIWGHNPEKPLKRIPQKPKALKESFFENFDEFRFRKSLNENFDQTLTIEISNIDDSQAKELMKALWTLQLFGIWGTSRAVKIWADGDGAFRPRIKINGNENFLDPSEKEKIKKEMDGGKEEYSVGID